MRARLFLAVLALCVVASSVGAQPEPRVVSRESITAAPGRKLDRYAKLALAPDGTGHVLLASVGTDKQPTIVELVRFDRAGKTTGRHTIATFTSDDFWLLRTQLLALPSGELLVVTPDRNLAGVPGRGGLLRLSADGKVLHRAPLHPPHDSPDRNNTDYNFDIAKLVATSDGNVVVGGSYGLGPNSWWWAKFTPNGVRLAEQSAQFFFLSTVDALSPTSDGGFLMVSRDFKDDTSNIVLQRHSPGGARLSRTLLLEKSEAHQVAFTSDGRIVVVKYGDPGQMLFFAADGKRLKEMPWTTPEYWWVAQLASDGTGVLLREETERDGFASQLARLDRDGAVVWKTPKGTYLDAASRGEEIVALVLENEGQAATIVRLANP